MYNSKSIILYPQVIVLMERYVQKGLPNQCWPWTGARSNHTDGKYGGYGNMSIYEGSKIIANFKSHRVAYVIEYGDFDWSLDVLHDCNNPPCCNPCHLKLGTHLDNMRNKPFEYDRSGENNPKAKLTEPDVLKIRLQYACGMKVTDIAKEWNVTRTNITDIVNYRTWKHVK